MDPLPQLAIALSIAVLLGGAAAHQLLAADEWPGIVRNYRLLPEPLVPAAAIALPLGEFLTACALLWPASRAFGAIAAAALLLVFAAALEVNLRRGRTHIDCGCLGSGTRGPRLRTQLARWMVARNAALAALALCLLQPAEPRPLSTFEIAAVMACVLTVAFLYPVLSVVLRPIPTLRDAGAARRPGASVRG